MIANIVTGIRIVCSVALVFTPALSPLFYVLYIIAGLTDMIDGTIARKTGTDSEFGAKLDTAADFVFVTVCLVKLIPVLDLDTWMYVCIVIIAVIKVISIISGVVKQKKPVAVHSVMNKITGLLLFVLPLTLWFIELKYSAAVVCAVAGIAAIQEGHIIRTGRSDG